MELSTLHQKAKEIIKKYRYGAIVLIVGIVLMLLPAKQEQNEVQVMKSEESNEISLESRLSDILSTVDGAGKTNVLLTVLAGEEIIYQEDEQISTDSDSKETKVTTITITGEDKAENGLIRQIVSPRYLGALIVSQGADKASVKFAIVDAVSKITGLGADQISVLKMK